MTFSLFAVYYECVSFFSMFTTFLLCVRFETDFRIWFGCKRKLAFVIILPAIFTWNMRVLLTHMPFIRYNFSMTESFPRKKHLFFILSLSLSLSLYSLFLLNIFRDKCFRSPSTSLASSLCLIDNCFVLQWYFLSTSQQNQKSKNPRFPRILSKGQNIFKCKKDNVSLNFYESMTLDRDVNCGSIVLLS